MSTKDVTRAGNITTWKSSARQPAASASRARIPAHAPSPGEVRTGAGPATSSPRPARARPRSAAPSPRAPANAAAMTGSPSTVTNSPMPSENIVTAKVKPTTAMGSEATV